MPRQNNYCIYCGRLADTREHVPSKSLLEKPFPINLWTVKACNTCNRGYSLDEEYFLVLLSRIGTSDSLIQKCQEGGRVARALARSPNFEKRILDALKYDSVIDMVRIEPESERIFRILQKIAIGIYVKKYSKIPILNTIIPLDAYPYNIEDFRPARLFADTLTEKFRFKKWHHIQEGVFSYTFLSNTHASNRKTLLMDFHRTLWGVVDIPKPNNGNFRDENQMYLFDPEES
ncbi:MAG: hypothetical protein IAF02_20870 [Anaerolineae bacterium]|nr:hypothetical protein [Anaerolineae bacterium]